MVHALGPRAGPLGPHAFEGPSAAAAEPTWRPRPWQRARELASTHLAAATAARLSTAAVAAGAGAAVATTSLIASDSPRLSLDNGTSLVNGSLSPSNHTAFEPIPMGIFSYRFMLTINMILLLISGAVVGLLDRCSPDLELVGPLSASPKPPVKLLPHLNGVRFLASCWIVAFHIATYFYSSFCSLPNASGYDFFLAEQGYQAVFYFVVISGFVTDWTAGSRDLLSSRRALLRFYIRRVDRVLFSSWASMAITLIIDAAKYGGSSSTLSHGAGAIISCIFFFPQWGGDYYCPNAPTWTIGALLYAWLLYPPLQLLIRALGGLGSAFTLVAFFGCAWGLTVGPYYVHLASNQWVEDYDEGLFAYYAPPMWVGTFAMGAIAAAITRYGVQSLHAFAPPAPAARKNVSGPTTFAGNGGAAAEEPLPTRWGWVAGVASDLVFGALLFFGVYPGQQCIPAQRGHHSRHTTQCGWAGMANQVETKFALPTLMALYLLLSSVSCGRTAGIATRVLSHGVLSRLGEYSFAIYLFQEPCFRLLAAIQGCGEVRSAPAPRHEAPPSAHARDASRSRARAHAEWHAPRQLYTIEGGLLLVFVIFVVSIVWTDFCEIPFTNWARACVEPRLADPKPPPSDVDLHSPIRRTRVPLVHSSQRE